MKAYTFFIIMLIISWSLTACQTDDIPPAIPHTMGEAIWQEGTVVKDLEQQLTFDLSPHRLPPALDTLLPINARTLPKMHGKVILDYQFEASLPSVSRASSLQRISGMAYYSRFLNYTLQYGIFDTGWQTDRAGFQVRTIVRGSYWQSGKVRKLPVECTVHGKKYTAHVPHNSRMVITEYARKGELSKRSQFVFDQLPTEPLSFWRSYHNQDERLVFCLTNRNTYYQKYPRAGKDKLIAQWQ
ncbi:MAG: hypothetical protein WBA23_06395 [Tunicatimonas sp.]|uniref:hypothetical protein n=1 Tax=Tunicatimonas sp. TaxID=1940096 RepID=UPI003C77FC6C